MATGVWVVCVGKREIAVTAAKVGGGGVKCCQPFCLQTRSRNIYMNEVIFRFENVAHF